MKLPWVEVEQGEERRDRERRTEVDMWRAGRREEDGVKDGEIVGMERERGVKLARR